MTLPAPTSFAGMLAELLLPTSKPIKRGIVVFKQLARKQEASKQEITGQEARTQEACQACTETT